MSFDLNRLVQAVPGPPEQLAEGLLKNALVDPAGSDHDLFVTLLRSSDYPPAAAYMRTLLDRRSSRQFFLKSVTKQFMAMMTEKDKQLRSFDAGDDGLLKGREFHRGMPG